ncbi:MAG: hypothetical protein HY264_01730 [Chloroflexi bacterium]|nr:hypothetical protein [Chloroflexota bacterium]
MTTNRDPDRILRAWLDLMPDEAPDRVVSAVSQAVETTPQVRRPLDLALRRFPRMNRYLIAGVMAALLVAAVFAVPTFLKPISGTGGPRPSPTAEPSPSGTPLVSGLGRGMGYATNVPAALTTAAWIADVDTIQGLFHDARIRLEAGAGRQQVAVTYGAGQPAQLSQPVTGAPESLSVVSLTDGSGCKAGNYGVYGLATSADGVTLTLTLVADECGPRASLLARTWTRSLDATSNGGRGVIGALDPPLLVTLPADRYVSGTGNNGAFIEGSRRTIVAFKDPVGWSEPCTASGGSRLAVAPNTVAFIDYLKTLPGFTVQTAAFAIDGQPGVRVTIPTSKTPACENNRVQEFTTNTPGDVGSFIRQGDTDVLYLVQVGVALYLLQWLGDGVTPAEEQAVLSTVHFIGSLPPRN